MRRLLVGIIVAALLWSGFWAYSVWQTRTNVADWFEARRADGWTAQYGALRVRGFPSRVDVTLEDVRLDDPDSGIGWDAPVFQILMLTYRPGHKILVFPETQVLRSAAGQFNIDSSGLLASVIHDSAGVIERANIEAEVLNIAGGASPRALADVTSGLLQDASQPETYRLGLSAATAMGPSGRVDAASLQAALQFGEVWRLSALKDPRPQLRRIDLRLAEYQAAGLDLKLAGALDVSETGLLDGQLKLKTVNWRDMLAQAQADSALPEGLARWLEQGLSLIAGLRGNPKSLDMPLNFREGQIWVGLLPLGRAPVMRVP